jgi:hypothetical protein
MDKVLPCWWRSICSNIPFCCLWGRECLCPLALSEVAFAQLNFSRSCDPSEPALLQRHIIPLLIGSPFKDYNHRSLHTQRNHFINSSVHDVIHQHYRDMHLSSENIRSRRQSHRQCSSLRRCIDHRWTRHTNQPSHFTGTKYLFRQLRYVLQGLCHQ